MLLKNPLLINVRKILLSKVKRGSVLWTVLHYIYRLAMPRIPHIPISKVLERYSEEKNGKVFFIYIGANEGVTDDLLRSHIVKNGWSGILVEPIKHIFDRLILNYKEYPNLIFENVAVADKEEIRLFYIPRIDGGAVLASFSLDVILSTRPDFKIEKDVIVERVQCVTLEKLLEKHGVVELNVLLIDAEGKDYEIIRSINFNMCNPEIIIFERNNLTFGDYRNCIKLLVKNEYKLRQDDNNVIAIKEVLLPLFKKTRK